MATAMDSDDEIDTRTLGNSFEDRSSNAFASKPSENGPEFSVSEGASKLSGLTLSSVDDDLSTSFAASRLQQQKRQGCLLEHVEISVVDQERRAGLNSVSLRETYIVYLIDTKVKDAEAAKGVIDLVAPGTSLWRRYSDFDVLRKYMEIVYPYVVIPSLPEKRYFTSHQSFSSRSLQHGKVMYGWSKLPTDKFDPDFIDRRRLGLENFLLRVASHPILGKDKIFHSFLHQEDNWRETVNATGYQAKADSKIQSMSASYRLKKPDKTFEDTKHYSAELHSSISNVLKSRARLTERVYAIHKLHGNYGRVFSEWSAIEKDNMGDCLQKAGHYMDVFAQCIDAMLDEEEQFSDQMKEYLSFADALRKVCRKQELMQLHAEHSEAHFSMKNTEREQLIEDKPSAFSFGGLRKMMGTHDTEEQKELKLRGLDEEIHDAEIQMQNAQREMDDFVKKSLQDIDRFKKEMVTDMKEILGFYAEMQIKMCKKNISLWTSTRDCFKSL